MLRSSRIKYCAKRSKKMSYKIAIPGVIAGLGELALKPSSLTMSALIGGSAAALVETYGVATSPLGGTDAGGKVKIVVIVAVLGAVAALAAAAAAQKAGLSPAARAALVAVAVTVAMFGQIGVIMGLGKL